MNFNDRSLPDLRIPVAKMVRHGSATPTPRVRYDTTVQANIGFF